MTNPYVGDAGGIAVGTESTFGTEAAAFVWLNTLPSSFGARRPMIDHGLLNNTYPTARLFSPGHADGDLGIGFVRSRAVNLFLANCGKLTTQTIAFGGGNVPDNDVGLSVRMNLGGPEMLYKGCSVGKLRWELAANQIVKQIATMIGGPGERDATPTTVTVPDITDVQLDSDLATFTIGGTACAVYGATIEVDMNRTGPDRKALGGSMHRRPVVQGPMTVTAQLQCELSVEAGASTIAYLDNYLAGTAVGDVVIDDWTLKGCYVSGEMPSVQTGIVQFQLNVLANYLELVTVA